MSTPSNQPPQSPYGSTEPVVCYRHHDRQTGLRCARCGRPACPECLREAAVGYQCLDCVREGRRSTPQPVTAVGARQRPGRPVVTIALIAVNVAIFLFTAIQAQSPNPARGSALFDAWVMWWPGVAGGQWWRVVTSGFLHFNIVHIAMNMIALWIIGRELEIVLGRLRFTTVYGLSLLGGSALMFLLSAAGAGASGAIFGLMGGVLIACYRLKINPRPILIVIALNVVITFTIPGISWEAHIGGFVIGAVATFALLYAPRAHRKQVQWGSMAALLVALVLVFALRDLSYGPVECFQAARCLVSRG